MGAVETAWRKSTYSGGNGGECVETASGNGAILVRDTADRGGVTLAVSAQAWTKFLKTVRLTAKETAATHCDDRPLSLAVRELLLAAYRLAPWWCRQASR
jgi:hypothetical protein